MTEDYLQGRGGAQIVADIPIGRVAHTSEVAEAIRWLAIDAPGLRDRNRDRRQRRELCSLAWQSCRRSRYGRSGNDERMARRLAPARTAGATQRRQSESSAMSIMSAPAGSSRCSITGPRGHILLDRRAPPKLLRSSRRTSSGCGFKLTDVKLIGGSHEHLDHVGGIAELQRRTGARVMARPPAFNPYETGVLNRQDPQSRAPSALPGSKVGQLLSDGQLVRSAP